MRGNVPFPELSGKRKLFDSSDLHREKLFSLSELLCLTARYVPRYGCSIRQDVPASHPKNHAYDSELNYSEVRASACFRDFWRGFDPMKDYHPSPNLLKRFLEGTLEAAERRRVVRHLLTGCPACQKVTRELMQGQTGLPEILWIVD
jgi:hypothetical protein